MSGKALLICVFYAGLAVAAAAQTAANQATDEAPWPCAQRRTPTISAAAVWAGPDIARAGDWEQDSDAAALAEKLASRRTPLADIDGLLDDFIKKTGADKDKRLTLVFAGALASINRERDRVLSGIAHFAKGQERLAEKVRKESEDVADDEEKGDAGAKALAEAKVEFAWDKRIFAERSQSLTYVCETPGILEQRAFEIARRIEQKL